MKILRFVLLFVLGAVMVRSQAPEDLTVTWRSWSSTPAAQLLGQVDAKQAGVWVSVFSTDPAVEAMSVTVNYVDEAGRNLTRTQITPRPYRSASVWFNDLFTVGKAKVKSILAVPLKAAGETRLVEVSEP